MKTPALLLALIVVLLAAVPARAEEIPTSADVTERGRAISNILDLILAPPAEPDPKGRTIVFLLDVTAALQRSDFPGELAAALTRNARQLAGTRIGIARTGIDGGMVLAATEDRQAVVESARTACTKVGRTFQNVYGDLRRILPAVRRGKGTREVVLVTLDNGDAEDDLEETVAELRRSRVRVSVIAREAFLSDSIWAQRPPRGPANVTFTGSDNAFIDLPWGFRFQWAIANNGILSGYAMFGLTRLAAATDGMVYLYYPPSGNPHSCLAHYRSSCLFCNRDHKPADEVYQTHRLRAISPPTLSRRKILEHAMSDPYYRAVQRAWQKASRKNVVYSRPSIEVSGGVLRLDPYPYRGWTPLGTTAAFDSEITRARRLARACKELGKELRQDIAEAREKGGSERYYALAETTRLMFEITHFNLLHYMAWCEHVGPVIADRYREDYEPPEVPTYADDLRFRGIGYWNLSLCHGIAPFRWVRLPGGAPMRRELVKLELSWKAFEKRWAHTPYLATARRFSFARFYLVQQPGYTRPGKRRVPDSKKEKQTTLPKRPARPARPGTGTSSDPGSGQTTGG